MKKMLSGRSEATTLPSALMISKNNSKVSVQCLSLVAWCLPPSRAVVQIRTRLMSQIVMTTIVKVEPLVLCPSPTNPILNKRNTSNQPKMGIQPTCCLTKVPAIFNIQILFHTAVRKRLTYTKKSVLEVRAKFLNSTRIVQIKNIMNCQIYIEVVHGQIRDILTTAL